MGREQLTVLEEAGPASTCALFSPQCRGLLRREGDFFGTCAVKTHCRRSLRSGRGLLGACALLLQHCRVCFATAPAWQLLERSRARQGRGPEAVRLWLFTPAPPFQLSSHKCSFAQVTAPTGGCCKEQKRPLSVP